MQLMRTELRSRAVYPAYTVHAMILFKTGKHVFCHSSFEESAYHASKITYRVASLIHLPSSKHSDNYFISASGPVETWLRQIWRRRKPLSSRYTGLLVHLPGLLLALGVAVTHPTAPTTAKQRVALLSTSAALIFNNLTDLEHLRVQDVESKAPGSGALIVVRRLNQSHARNVERNPIVVGIDGLCHVVFGALVHLEARLESGLDILAELVGDGGTVTHGGGSQDNSSSLEAEPLHVFVRRIATIANLVKFGLELAAVELLAQLFRVIGVVEVLNSEVLAEDSDDLEVAVALEETLSPEAHAVRQWVSLVSCSTR